MKLVTLTSCLGILGFLSVGSVYAENYLYGPPDVSLNEIGPNIVMFLRYFVGMFFFAIGLLGMIMSKCLK